jgi:hypothetical protein
VPSTVADEYWAASLVVTAPFPLTCGYNYQAAAGRVDLHTCRVDMAGTVEWDFVNRATNFTNPVTESFDQDSKDPSVIPSQFEEKPKTLESASMTRWFPQIECHRHLLPCHFSQSFGRSVSESAALRNRRLYSASTENELHNKRFDNNDGDSVIALKTCSYLPQKNA